MYEYRISLLAYNKRQAASGDSSMYPKSIGHECAILVFLDKDILVRHLDEIFTVLIFK